MTLRSSLVLALCALLATSSAVAQTRVIDEGSFRISVRDAAIGTETFSIGRSGSGANTSTVAQGRVMLNTGVQTRAVFQLRGPDLRPAAYQIEILGDNHQNITGRAAGNRFRATIVSGTGEQMREYLVDAHAVILHDGLVYPHFFAAAAVREGGSLPVIIPRQNRQVMARVQVSAAEEIQLAGHQVSARRITLEVPGLDDRTLWVDAHNRVLRLRIPEQALVAERTNLPR